MRFFSLFSILFLLCTEVWSLPKIPGYVPTTPSMGVDGKELIISKQVVKVMGSIEKMDKQMQELNSALGKLHSYKSTVKVIFRLMKIGAVSHKLESAMKKATKRIEKCHPFTKDESEAVMHLLMQSGPHGQQMMDTLIAHKQDFDTAIFHAGSLSHTVARAMRKTQVKAERFQKALMAKLTPEYAVMGPVMAAHIKKTYDDLVAIFEVSGGKFDVPDIGAFKDFVVDKLNPKHHHYVVCEEENGKKYCFDYKSRRKYEKFVAEHPGKVRIPEWQVKHE